MNEPTRERLPDIFYGLDYPVLLEAARWAVDGRQDGALQVEAIAQRTGEPMGRVLGSLLRLADGGYVEIRTERGDNQVTHAMVVAVLPDGLRETGPWPRGEDLAATLREVLEAQVRLLERQDPERGHKARRVLELLTGAGTEFTVGLAQALAKAYLHLPS
jgi:hypothetical protein